MKQSAPDFFVSKDSTLIALNDSLIPFLINPVFTEQVKDIIDYRTIHYYSKKYRDSNRIPMEYKMKEPEYLMAADSGVITK